LAAQLNALHSGTQLAHYTLLLCIRYYM